MVDCKWSDSKSGTVEYAYVPLGRKYALASGLMQITYNTGATVILEGPCRYTVEAESGGYLGIGRLTAKLEQKGRRGEEGSTTAANQQSPFRVPPSAFFVRTPTAKVTDLGTEFGVSVDTSGMTESHVFRGTVLLAAAGSRQDSTSIALARMSRRESRRRPAAKFSW